MNFNKYKLQFAASSTQMFDCLCLSLDHRVCLLVASFSLAASSGSCPGRCTHSHTYTAAHLHVHSHRRTHTHTVARKRAQKLFIVPLFLSFFDNCLNLRLFLHIFLCYLLICVENEKIFMNQSRLFIECAKWFAYFRLLSLLCLNLVSFIYSTHFDGFSFGNLKQISGNFCYKTFDNFTPERGKGVRRETLSENDLHNSISLHTPRRTQNCRWQLVTHEYIYLYI